jgi:hypothetical protein
MNSCQRGGWGALNAPVRGTLGCCPLRERCLSTHVLHSPKPRDREFYLARLLLSCSRAPVPEDLSIWGLDDGCACRGKNRSTTRMLTFTCLIASVAHISMSEKCVGYAIRTNNHSDADSSSGVKKKNRTCTSNSCLEDAVSQAYFSYSQVLTSALFN